MGGLFQISEPYHDDPEILSYEICGNDRIVAMNGDWAGMGGTARGQLLHMSLWSLLGDGNVADIYQALIRQIRRQQRGLRFRFRCDDPQTRRVMSMSMEPVGTGGIRFSSRPVAVEAQNARDFFGRHQRRPQDVDVCHGCGAIRVGDGWEPPDQAVEALGLFADDLVFKTWPVPCPDCGGGH